MSGSPSRLPRVSLAAGLTLGIALLASLGVPRRVVSLIGSGPVLERLDGRVEPGEYQFEWSDAASGITFSWRVQGDRLVGGLSSPDTGWVAVGFGGDGPLMYGADIVIGYVDSRGAHLRDHFADTPTNHSPDTALGGSHDVLAGAGLETSSGTTLEFERPLAAHDSVDRAIEAGQTHVIAASSESDDFTAYHVGGRKAVVLLDLFAGPAAPRARASAFPDHLSDVQILLATWTALFLVVGIHGVASRWMERGPGSARALDMWTTLIGVLLLAELAAGGGFAAAISLRAPVWVLGSTLAVGLVALAGLVTLYSRAFVPFQTVRSERDDGIPW